MSSAWDLTHVERGDAVEPRRYEGPLVSSDSHVIEDPLLWKRRLPSSFGDDAPVFRDEAGPFQGQAGGFDASARLGEMATDGVSAEVLYPTLALSLFRLKDSSLQAACFRLYNDWLAEYCSVAPDRLIGIAALSCYDIGEAVRELFRAKSLGMRGAVIWQTPPEDLGFETDHYERLWAAAAEIQMPVSLHILTGFDWSQALSASLAGYELSSAEASDKDVRRGAYGFRGMTNYKLLGAANAVHDLIVSGALQRHPGLRIVLVENEVGWIPFVLDQWDKYFHRPQRFVTTIDRPPSEFFRRQMRATFFNDHPGAMQFSWWGADVCMWSNDFPHPNSTWPHSRDVVSRDLGALEPDVQERLAWRTCAELYGLDSFLLQG